MIAERPKTAPLQSDSSAQGVRTWEDALEDDLSRLRRLAGDSPRHAPGRVRLGPFELHYADAASLYIEFKDIFVRRVYHFQSDKPNPRIIDGGACIGLATLYFKHVYPEARVICFEPDPAARALLEVNLAANACTDVQIIAAALSGGRAPAPFSADGADGGRVVRQGAAMTVPSLPLSDFIKEPIDYVKLNIEGMEANVIHELEAAGRLTLIRELAIEYHGWPGEPQRLGEILTTLDRAGFQYLVHDFDAETCSISKPPFRIRDEAPWFCLIYARNSDEPRTRRPVTINWGDLRRTTPVSRQFGFDRGRPIDRYYVDRFIESNARDIRGRVLEIGDAEYTRRFGGDRVVKSDVLHAQPGNAKATLVGDLSTGGGVPKDAFDCVILTQTLHCVYDLRNAIRTVARALRPGGVVLATVPGISQISRYDMDRWGDFWRFTTLSIRRVFGDAFGVAQVRVESFGNVLAATAFLHGLASHELSAEELDETDVDYELVMAVRAVRSGGCPA